MMQQQLAQKRIRQTKQNRRKAGQRRSEMHITIFEPLKFMALSL
jgi:hypothetical protein